MLARRNIAEDIVDQLVQETNYTDDVLGPLLEAPPACWRRRCRTSTRRRRRWCSCTCRRAARACCSPRCPDGQRAETVLRMADVATVGDEVIDEVAASLPERLRRARPEARRTASQRTATVLGTMARVTRSAILDELEADHPEQAQQLRDKLYTFDSLIVADDRGIQELLASVDNQQIALALDGVEPELERLFMENLSERAASRLREEMELNVKATRTDKENARKEILAIAMQLEADGKLSFSEPEADDE